MPKSATRLYAILARDARVGVVFRRGPSRQVQLVRWDLAEDRFEPGQWFKGRIYERRCDLSPDGQKLIYFAASYRGPIRTWTAVSTPPYLTALALWPNGGAWGEAGSSRPTGTSSSTSGPMACAWQTGSACLRA